MGGETDQAPSFPLMGKVSGECRTVGVKAHSAFWSLIVTHSTLLRPAGFGRSASPIKGEDLVFLASPHHLSSLSVAPRKRGMEAGPKGYAGAGANRSGCRGSARRLHANNDRKHFASCKCEQRTEHHACDHPESDRLAPGLSGKP